MDNTATRQPASPAIVFLLPFILVSLLVVGFIGMCVSIWKYALTNREFRDTVTQLEATIQNSWEAFLGSLRFPW